MKLRDCCYRRIINKSFVLYKLYTELWKCVTKWIVILLIRNVLSVENNFIFQFFYCKVFLQILKIQGLHSLPKLRQESSYWSCSLLSHYILQAKAVIYTVACVWLSPPLWVSLTLTEYSHNTDSKIHLVHLYSTKAPKHKR